MILEYRSLTKNVTLIQMLKQVIKQTERKQLTNLAISHTGFERKVMSWWKRCHIYIRLPQRLFISNLTVVTHALDSITKEGKTGGSLWDRATKQVLELFNQNNYTENLWLKNQTKKKSFLWF